MYLVPIFPSWVMVLTLSKEVIFLQFSAGSARNLSLLEQFTYMHLKDLVRYIQKMVLSIILQLTVSEILGLEVEEFYISADSASFFDILIANISWTVSQIPINHIIFWKSVMRTFRCIYVNCFHRIRFLAQNCKICTFLDNLRKEHNPGRKVTATGLESWTT